MGISLLILAFILSLDTMRVAISLGTLHSRPLWQFQFAAIFALVEAVTLLLGLIAGRSALDIGGDWTRYVAVLIFGGLGLYSVLVGLDRVPTKLDLQSPWMLWGLPLALSLDNLLAGVGLGLTGFTAVPSALLIGIVSGLMALVGLRLGSLLRKHVPIRAELLGGLSLLFLAVLALVDVS